MRQITLLSVKEACEIFKPLLMRWIAERSEEVKEG